MNENPHEILVDLRRHIGLMYNHSAGYADIMDNMAGILKSEPDSGSAVADGIQQATAHFRHLLGLEKNAVPFPDTPTGP